MRNLQGGGRWPTWACVGTAVLLAGCDGREPISPESRDGPLTNMEYDYTDTWMAVEIDMHTQTTITTDQPFADPRTGQPTTSLAVSSPVEDLSLSGGYNSYGDFIGDLRHPLDAEVEPGTRIAQTRFEWGTSVHYDEYGNRMPDVLPDGSPAPVISADDYLPPEGEPLTSGVIIEETANFYDNGSGDSRCGTQVVCSMSPSGVAVKRRIEQPDAYTVRVIDELDEAPGLAISASRAVADGAASQRAGADPQSTGKTKATRTYRKRGDVFVLDEVRLERDEEARGSRAKHVQTLRYRKVKWHRNKEKDKQRAEKAKEKKVAQAGAPVQPAPRQHAGDAGGAAGVLGIAAEEPRGNEHRAEHLGVAHPGLRIFTRTQPL